jgi:hypothetical protein
MEFVRVLRELSKRRLLLAIGVLVAIVAATFSVYRLDGLKLKSRSLQYSSASTQVLVDSPSSVLGNLSQSFEPLTARALVYANFLASPAVLNLVGKHVGISGEQIYAAGPVDAALPRVEQEPTALKRNVEITGETNPYRLSFNSDPRLPTIDIYAQAPTTPQAIALADASIVGLQEYVTSLENTDRVPNHSRVTIRQLGRANGGVVDGGISKALAVLVFFGVFLLWCVLILVGTRFREYWRTSATFDGELDNGSGGAGQAARSLGEDNGEATEAVRRGGRIYAPDIPPYEAPSAHESERTPVATRSAR